jgi:hypothetical protein
MRRWMNGLVCVAAVGVAGFGATGCTTWEMDVQKGSITDIRRASPQTDPDNVFSSATPYLFVRASIDRPEKAENICGDSWVASVASKKNVAVALAAELGAVKLPLFSQGYDGDKRICTRKYEAAFVVPRIMADQAFLAIPLTTGWTRDSKSQVSGYLDSGLKLAGALGGATAPVVTTIGTVVASELAKQVEAEINRSMSFSDQAKFNAIELEMSQAKKDMIDRDYVFQVIGVETSNFQPKEGGKRVHLATLTLRLRWVRTAVGEDTGTGVVFADDPPANTRVRVFTDNPNDPTKTLSVLMAERRVDTAVPYMSAATDWNSAKSGCNAFRTAFAEFNQLDQTALLWIAYRQSEKGMQSARNNFAQDPCFTARQVQALTSMGLPPVQPPQAMALSN